MTTPADWFYGWETNGLHLILRRDGAPLPFGQWAGVAGDAVHALHPFATHPEVESVFLSHRNVAGLSDYEATLLGLARHAEAVMVVRVEGRIDHPEFRVECRLEPMSHAHPWTVYQRQGVQLFVGEHVLRLNVHQLQLFEALDGMKKAGADVAARLRAWPALAHALHAPEHARVLVQGPVPHVQINRVDEFPPTAMTRVGRLLQRVAGAEWAMLAQRKYFLRVAYSPAAAASDGGVLQAR